MSFSPKIDKVPFKNIEFARNTPQMAPKEVYVGRGQMALASFCKNTKLFQIMGSITVV